MKEKFTTKKNLDKRAEYARRLKIYLKKIDSKTIKKNDT